MLGCPYHRCTWSELENTTATIKQHYWISWFQCCSLLPWANCLTAMICLTAIVQETASIRLPTFNLSTVNLYISISLSSENWGSKETGTKPHSSNFWIFFFICVRTVWSISFHNGCVQCIFFVTNSKLTEGIRNPFFKGTCRTIERHPEVFDLKISFIF